MTALTLVEPLTCAHGHDLFLLVSALGTGENGLQNELRHRATRVSVSVKCGPELLTRLPHNGPRAGERE